MTSYDRVNTNLTVTHDCCIGTSEHQHVEILSASKGIFAYSVFTHTPARASAPLGMPARMPDSTTTVFISRSKCESWSTTPASHSSL